MEEKLDQEILANKIMYNSFETRLYKIEARQVG